MRFSFFFEFFNRFVRNHGMGRHFRRLMMFEHLSREGVSRDIPPLVADSLKKAAHATADELIVKLGSHEHGLTNAQADELRVQFGLNEIHEEKPITWRKIPAGGAHCIGAIVVVFVGIVKAKNSEKGRIIIGISDGVIRSGKFPYKV